MGFGVPVRTATTRARITTGSPAPAAAAAPAPELPTVEIIRGDKRAHEAVRQEP
jgi:hypothetical protein